LADFSWYNIPTSYQHTKIPISNIPIWQKYTK
jgi:hypothetical protein